MSTLSIFVLSLFAVTANGPTDIAATSTGEEQLQVIRVAQAQSGCCRQWDTSSRVWRKIGTVKSKCVKLNARFDRKEKEKDIVKRQGRIWWDQRCDNKP